MKHRFESEAELGQRVTEWLSQAGWDVFPEVTSGGGDERADIVAVCGPLLWVVECKLSFGLPVLAQAHRWLGRAHYVSVAVPSIHGSESAAFGRQIAADYGIGIIVADEMPRSGWVVKPAAFHRRAATKRLRKLLHVGQKAFTAGASAGFYTPYQGTCAALRSLLDQHPEGLPVKEAIERIKEQHHYSTDATARASMMKWARLGRVEGVRLDESTRPARFVRETTR